MNKDKFAVLMAVITADIINKIIEKYGYDENKAMELFYKSKLYSVLEREETKFWYYSSQMILELFDREMKGNLEFPEV